MKCKACGTEIANDAKFCNFCGTKVEETKNVNDENVEANAVSKDNEEKYSTKEMIDKIANLVTYGLSAVSIVMIIGALLGFFDKNPIPFIVFVGVIFIAERLEEKLPKVPTVFFAAFEIIALIVCFNIGNNVGSVLAVKEGCPSQYPNITYEQAFDDYFANPKWESCGKDEDGNEVVMFTGTCEYMGTDAIAEIKFTVYKEQESFVVSSVKLNGEDMDMWGNVLVMDVFEEYQNAKNGIDTSESYTESYLEEDVSEMPPADASVSIEEVTLRSGTYRNENSKFVFTISEPYYSEENTVCVNVYAGIEGDEYRHERVGVVYEPWKEIWTGYGNFEYDGENGLITGQGLSALIYYFDDEEMDDLEVEYTYYLDSFEGDEEEQVLEETVIDQNSSGEFVGLQGDYVCTNVSDGEWTGRIQFYQDNPEYIFFELSTLDGPQDIMAAVAYIKDDCTAVYDDGYGFSVTFSWVNAETIYVSYEGELSGTDSGTIMDLCDERNYYRAPEFN